MSLNRVQIMGRLTRDLEVKQTQNGISVASFTIAVDGDFASKDTGKKPTYFIDCVAWRFTAEFMQKYLNQKGRMVVIDGHIETRNWQDKEGNNRKSTEVVADNVYFGDSKPSEGGQSQQMNRNTPQQNSDYNHAQNGGFTASQNYQQNQYGQQFTQHPSGFIPDNQNNGTLPF